MASPSFIPAAGFLTDFWRDVLNLAGFLGVIIAIVQITRTKGVADASREASSKALEQARLAFWQYSLATVQRLLSEAKSFVDASNWQGAALRTGDLAELAAQMAQSDDSAEKAKWGSLATEFRGWESTWRQTRVGVAAPNVLNKWHKFSMAASVQCDSHHRPFATQMDRGHRDGS